jgi:hypothetical protein
MRDTPPLPLPPPKPWIRKSADVIAQAQAMMAPPVDREPIIDEDDPE